MREWMLSGGVIDRARWTHDKGSDNPNLSIKAASIFTQTNQNNDKGDEIHADGLNLSDFRGVDFHPREVNCTVHESRSEF